MLVEGRTASWKRSRAALPVSPRRVDRRLRMSVPMSWEVLVKMWNVSWLVRAPAGNGRVVSRLGRRKVSAGI